MEGNIVIWDERERVVGWERILRKGKRKRRQDTYVCLLRVCVFFIIIIIIFFFFSFWLFDLSNVNCRCQRERQEKTALVCGGLAGWLAIGTMSWNVDKSKFINLFRVSNESPRTFTFSESILILNTRWERVEVKRILILIWCQVQFLGLIMIKQIS